MDAFVALADPTRRRIVESLTAGERAFGDIAADFDISGPAVSQHLKVLRDAGIVGVRRDAQRRIYSLDPRGLDDMSDWLNRLRGFWNHRLDDLERALGKPV